MVAGHGKIQRRSAQKTAAERKQQCVCVCVWQKNAKQQTLWKTKNWACQDFWSLHVWTKQWIAEILGWFCVFEFPMLGKTLVWELVGFQSSPLRSGGGEVGKGIQYSKAEAMKRSYRQFYEARLLTPLRICQGKQWVHIFYQNWWIIEPMN